ncbi:hypothetical protein [Rheinheimera sp. NSM]|uniref:hypothetical protein n=1 Tax=Rheinheimera sp. NSM TaxID=3457884 RepID=UPI00403601CE
MDVNLSYAEWLSQLAVDDSQRKLAFADGSAVLFDRLTHETRQDITAVTTVPDKNERTLG